MSLLVRCIFVRFLPQLLSGLLIIMLSGCQTSPPSVISTTDQVPFGAPVDGNIYQDELQTMLLLYQQHDKWQGTPYQIGGISRAGVDCSGFVKITFQDLFGIDLPRTTSDQLRAGYRISRADLQPGDLVFFRRGRHVGIYLDGHQFLHASTTRGVMISNLKNSYWSRHYWEAIRLNR